MMSCTVGRGNKERRNEFNEDTNRFGGRKVKQKKKNVFLFLFLLLLFIVTGAWTGHGPHGKWRLPGVYPTYQLLQQFEKLGTKTFDHLWRCKLVRSCIGSNCRIPKKRALVCSRYFFDTLFLTGTHSVEQYNNNNNMAVDETMGNLNESMVYQWLYSCSLNSFMTESASTSS